MTEADKKIGVGDLVVVYYPTSDQTNNPARKFNGEQFVVKTVLLPKRANGRRQYTLYGAESSAGMPYWFLEDELVKL